MNVEWSRRLKAGFQAAPNPSRQVRLPDAKSFTVTGDGDTAHLHLSEIAVTANMQSDAAAFESWCLALRRWCGVAVHLSWQVPTNGGHAHYARFLYRLKQFNLLFGNDWFSYADPTNALGQATVTNGKAALWLNVGGSKEKVQKERPADATRWSEDHWESYLASPETKWLEHAFELGDGTIKDQQFPVGLFSTAVPAKASAVFPGAKSAIDILALDGTRLWLFELKKPGNAGLGALSELLFYTSVMRDAVTGVFGFAEGQGRSRSRLGRDAIRSATEIVAVLLAPEIHPLIDPELVQLLNNACDARLGAAPRVTFKTHHLDANGWSSSKPENSSMSIS